MKNANSLWPVLVCALLAALPARAEGFWERNALVDLSVPGARSAYVASMAAGGFDLSDGTYQPFSDFYTPEVREVEVIFWRRLSSRYELLWGFSTGERSDKHTIEPALHLGLVSRWRLGRRAWLSLQGLAVIGGDVSERPCVADYGGVGGVQEVNCRLAASTLPPAETLKHLIDREGSQDNWVKMTYTLRF